MSEVCLSEEKFACEKFAYVSNEICAWAKQWGPRVSGQIRPECPGHCRMTQIWTAPWPHVATSGRMITLCMQRIHYKSHTPKRTV